MPIDQVHEVKEGRIKAAPTTRARAPAAFVPAIQGGRGRTGAHTPEGLHEFCTVSFGEGEPTFVEAIARRGRDNHAYSEIGTA